MSNLSSIKRQPMEFMIIIIVSDCNAPHIFQFPIFIYPGLSIDHPRFVPFFSQFRIDRSFLYLLGSVLRFSVRPFVVRARTTLSVSAWCRMLSLSLCAIAIISPPELKNYDYVCWFAVSPWILFPRCKELSTGSPSSTAYQDSRIISDHAQVRTKHKLISTETHCVLISNNKFNK